MKVPFMLARVVPERQCIELVAIAGNAVAFVDVSGEAFDAIKADYGHGLFDVPLRDKKYRMLKAAWMFDVVEVSKKMIAQGHVSVHQYALSEVGKEQMDKALNIVIADFLVNGKREIRDFEVIARRYDEIHSKDVNCLGGQRDQNVYKIGYVGSEIVLEGNPKALCEQIDQLRAEGKIPASKYSASRNSIIGKLLKGADQAEGWHLCK